MQTSPPSTYQACSWTFPLIQRAELSKGYGYSVHTSKLKQSVKIHPYVPLCSKSNSSTFNKWNEALQQEVSHCQNYNTITSPGCLSHIERSFFRAWIYNVPQDYIKTHAWCAMVHRSQLEVQVILGFALATIITHVAELRDVQCCCIRHPHSSQKVMLFSCLIILILPFHPQEDQIFAGCDPWNLPQCILHPLQTWRLSLSLATEDNCLRYRRVDE